MATKTTSTRRPKRATEVPSNADPIDVSNEPAEKKSDGNGNNAVMLNLAGLKDMSISELTHIAKEMGIEGASGLSRPGG